MSLFAEFNNRCWIGAILEMATALAVGSRASLEPTGTDMPVVKGPDGLPFIPGSSLKGVFRFQTERILRAWNKRPDLWACDPLADPCVGPARKAELWEEAEEDDAAFAEKAFAESCTACRLFGSPWFAGRVAFKDAFLCNEHDLPVVTQIRDGVGIDRDLGAARTGVKYDFETVVPGACFAVEIVTENLEDWEIGLLLMVVRMWEEGDIAVGGKTTRGTGWGRLKGLSIRRVDADNLLDYLADRKTRSESPDTFIRTFRAYFKAKEGADA
ncbi:MAG: CRISPR-associated RAMP protein Csx7 [Anaerolineales bacterium]